MRKQIKKSPLLICTKDMAIIISKSEFTTRKMAREGIIPSYKFNGIHYYDPEEVIAAIKNNGKSI